MSKFSSYFNDEFVSLEQGSKSIDEILKARLVNLRYYPLNLMKLLLAR